MSRLQRELKKHGAFDSAEQEAILNILRTNDQFQNQFGKLFRSFEITSSQYNVLRILRGHGKSLQIQEIASQMIQVVPAMTGLIDRLEEQQLVRRERCQNDRRVIYIGLTDQGKKLLASMDNAVKAQHEKLIGHLTKSELKELTRLLEKARQSIAPP
jgi:MarR family transcriptional regulator, 2-MHQ and catechol-resistance regulon repressor